MSCVRTYGNDVGYDVGFWADMETWFEQPLHRCVAESGGIVDPYFDGLRFGKGDAVGVDNHS